MISGNTPRKVVSEVSKIGRNRSFVPSITARADLVALGQILVIQNRGITSELLITTPAKPI